MSPFDNSIADSDPVSQLSTLANDIIEFETSCFDAELKLLPLAEMEIRGRRRSLDAKLGDLVTETYMTVTTPSIPLPYLQEKIGPFAKACLELLGWERTVERAESRSALEKTFAHYGMATPSDEQLLLARLDELRNQCGIPTEAWPRFLRAKFNAGRQEDLTVDQMKAVSTLLFDLKDRRAWLLRRIHAVYDQMPALGPLKAACRKSATSTSGPTEKARRRLLELVELCDLKLQLIGFVTRTNVLGVGGLRSIVEEVYSGARKDSALLAIRGLKVLDMPSVEDSTQAIRAIQDLQSDLQSHAEELAKRLEAEVPKFRQGNNGSSGNPIPDQSADAADLLPTQCNLGWLIAKIEADEAFRESVEQDYREYLKTDPFRAGIWKNDHVGSYFVKDNEQMPGVDRIERLCDQRFDGTGLKSANLRRLRAELCEKLGRSMTEVSALTLDAAADALERKDMHAILELDQWARRVTDAEIGEFLANTPTSPPQVLTTHRRQEFAAEGETLASEATKCATQLGIPFCAEWEPRWLKLRDAVNSVMNNVTGPTWFALSPEARIEAHKELLKRIEACREASAAALRLARAYCPECESESNGAGNILWTWPALIEYMRRRAPAEQTVGTDNGDESESDAKGTKELRENEEGLKPSREKAYRLFQWAMEQNPNLKTDQDVYNWLNERTDIPDDLPSFDSWSKYLRDARAYHEDHKHTPRTTKEVSGKSVVRRDQI